MFTGDWETGPAPTQITESLTYTALPTTKLHHYHEYILHNHRLL